MQITAEIDLDDIVSEVEQAITESSSFDSHVNDLVNSLVEDQVEQSLDNRGIDPDEFLAVVRGEIEDAVSNLTADDVDGLDSMVEDYTRDAVADALADAADPQGAEDRIANLEQSVEALAAQVEVLTEALQAAAILLARSVKV